MVATSEDEDDENEEDGLLKWIEEHIKDKGHITLEDIKEMIEKKMMEQVKKHMKP